jgi:hypothetical protein
MDNKNGGSFWPSYVDIMTTLFAITLVLFVVSFSRFKTKEKQLQSLVDEYENIITVYSTVGTIDSTAYFGYNETYLKHLFCVDVKYQDREYDIQDKLELDNTDSVAANAKRDSIVQAGILVQNTIQSLKNTNGVKNNIKFLVIIEGQSSRVKFSISDWQNNYTLSYMRAQFLNEFWKKNGIDLASIPKCELIISGSGEAGVPRNQPDEEKLHRLFPDSKDYWEHWKQEETKNQRFLVHIVPVIGNIDVTKEKIERLKGKKTDE